MSKTRARIAVAGLLLLHAALLGWSAARNSVTFDEFAHLPAGLSYWRYGKFDVYDYTPPLPRMLGSWPALAAGARVPELGPYLEMETGERHWRYGEEFLRLNRERYHRLFVLGRWGLIPVSCLGGWLVYCWARELYGAPAGIVSCALYVLCPNLLAHGSISGTDTATVVAMLAAAYGWWQFCRRLSWTWWSVAALALSAALLCKFTAILLFGAMLLIAWFVAVRQRHVWKHIALGYVAAALAALILLNAGYLFEGFGRRLDSFGFQSRSIRRLAIAAPALRLPVPAPMLEGMDVLNWEMEVGTPGFLFGEGYVGWRWYYFPIVLLCKLPLGTLALILWSMAALAGWGTVRRAVSGDERALLATVLLYLLFAMFLGRVNLGVRYVMPILPLLFVLAGRVWPQEGGDAAVQRASEFSSQSVPAGRVKLIRAVVILLIVGVAVESLSVAPRFLTFVNLAFGGPRYGYRIVNDSNFDWGQGLLDLKRWMQDNNVPRVQLFYFGRVEPSVYGIDYVSITDPSDEPYVAVSSYFLAGMAHRIHTRQGVSSFVRLEWFRELQEVRPVARVGNSIYVFARKDFDAAARQHAALKML